MDFPKYVLKKKKLNKKKSATVFRRNYLNINDFQEYEDGWIFEEKFVHHGTACEFRFIVHHPDIDIIFKFDSKTLKIKGNRQEFGIFIRMPNQGVPFTAQGKMDCIEYHIECTGRCLAYDDGTGISNTREKQVLQQMQKDRKPKKNNSLAPYANAGYSMTHPYQGGGISPR